MANERSGSADRSERGNRVDRLLATAGVVHPLPSVINAALVASLAIVAGGEPRVAVALAFAMLGFQFSIGSLNDLVDADKDRVAKPSKPIPAGLVSPSVATGIVIAGGALGLVVSAAFGLVVVLLGAAGYASGLAYDVFMRRWGVGWLCFSAAFPLLLAWTWMAAATALPSNAAFLFLMAALAGPIVHLANSLVDLEDDVRIGQTSLATQLGTERARRLLVVLTIAIYALGWSALVAAESAGILAVVTAMLATAGATIGVALSWQATWRAREAGWLLQATALGAMAVALLASTQGD